MHTSKTRTMTATLWRVTKQALADPTKPQPPAIMQTLADCLQLTVSTVGDDRLLAQDRRAYMGNGNRWKRRAGWRLLKHYCRHMDGGYDCACEPQSWYYYAQP